MGLIPRGGGRGRGRECNFQNKLWGGTSIISQQVVHMSEPNGMFYPGNSFGGPQVFGDPSSFNINPLRPACGNFFQKNTNRRQLTSSNDLQLVHGTKWTEPYYQESKHDNKKQRFLDSRKKPKHYQKWNNYKVLGRDNNLGVKNHYCETCDKSFKTQEDLVLHKAEHETCSRDGCEFTAHPKIIAKHIKMQHESGLYRRIGNLYTEEDIAKWIEERKKRYPTRKVIEDKKILEEEKIKRGERIKDDDSKFNKSFNKKNRKAWKKDVEKQIHRISKNKRTRRRKETSLLHKHLEEEQAEEVRKGIPAFSGIRNTNELELPEKIESNISDDDWEPPSEILNASKTWLNNSLGLLAECYNSDEDNPGKDPQNDVKENISADEESGPEEVKTISIKNSLLEEKPNEKKLFLKRKIMGKKELTKSKRQNSYNQSNVQEKSLTLLEKLLKKEIKHERNIILQCIHYVVTHNFFNS